MGLAKAAIAFAALFLLLQLGAAPLSARGRRYSNATIPQGITYPSGSLKDGMYRGTADGYMPGLSVEVAVKGGKIDSVRIAENDETPRWLSMVSGVIPRRIVAAQGTEIDIVSGATASSHGIMSAVEDALGKAAK
ncbi:MAG TPA: FMN-binding protein [Spirochaetales bacterium]|nr:FMN-binding protein [Spirochaetales bacterium]HRZ64683.1 FMN-binding protein [Spirochaetia bacterium]